jgi:ferric iron reductase protein FhuF
MAWRSLPLSDELIWRAPLPTAERALAESIREKIATLRPHLLDFLRLDEPAPGTR